MLNSECPSSGEFLNNVQEFYNARAMLEQQSKDWIYFKKPFTKEEEYELFLGGQFESTTDMCRWLLEGKRLENYMDFVSVRMTAYLAFLKLTNLNEENKFLMNITEQDLEDFVNHTYREIRRAKKRDLVGTWNSVQADYMNNVAYEFQNDNTFTTHRSIKYGHSQFRGKMVQLYTLSGTWTIEGDSLVMHYDMKSYKLKIDDSEISYPSHLADSISMMKRDLASEMFKPGFVRRLEWNNRTALATNLDESGTRLELTDGEDNTMHYQKKIN